MPTLLLVEDDDAFRYAASRYLTAAGFKVVSVPTTVKALVEVDSGLHTDALVLDVAMPAGNPLGVSFALMMRRRQPAIPVLLMTAFPGLLKGYRLPGKILYKPIDLDKLTDEVRALFPAPL